MFQSNPAALSRLLKSELDYLPNMNALEIDFDAQSYFVGSSSSDSVMTEKRAIVLGVSCSIGFIAFLGIVYVMYSRGMLCHGTSTNTRMPRGMIELKEPDIPGHALDVLDVDDDDGNGNIDIRSNSIAPIASATEVVPASVVI